MDLAELTSLIAEPSRANCSVRLSGRVCFDSRRVQPGDVFVAVAGTHADGHDFVAQAQTQGASAIVAERTLDVGPDVPLVKVGSSAVALGQLAQAQHGRPAAELTNLAVTGTNGKTTVAYLTRAIMAQAGLSCGMIGTVEYDVGSGVLEADNTTPDALRLARMMRQMRNNNLDAMVMECSSHGLDQDRTAGIDFRAAAFTNLTGDHYDYHGGRPQYLAAKAKLFVNLAESSVAVLNADDAATSELIPQIRAQVWRYGIESGAPITCSVEAEGIWGCEIDLHLFDEHERFRLPLIGLHNVSNLMAAAGLARAAGVSLSAIAQAAENFPGVPGRLERIEGGHDFAVLVDYAHTDDALKRVLETVQPLATGRVIVVFGCGGQRDRSKRPRMAKAAEEFADHVIVTNDNPRREDPEQIAQEIMAGFSPAKRSDVTQLLDRPGAIELAISQARPGDVVLIAGKGHEDYQDIGGEKLQGPQYDDRKIAQSVLAAEGARAKVSRQGGSTEFVGRGLPRRLM